jgi:hypothetical protein
MRIRQAWHKDLPTAIDNLSAFGSSDGNRADPLDLASDNQQVARSQFIADTTPSNSSRFLVGSRQD